MPSQKQLANKGVLPENLLSQYEAMVQEGRIADDAAQRAVLAVLEDIRISISKKGTLSKLLRRSPDMGLYIWGNVGRGKSMVMDLFFHSIPLEKKRRVHFHAFMQEVHARIHELRRSQMQGGGDPVAVLAREIASSTELLCFDELQAADVADATILYRLFQGLYDTGVLIVSTSNHPPSSLYTGGVQRERFEKFIALIEANMRVIALSSAEDYRYLQGSRLTSTYHAPLGAGAERFIADAIERVTMHPKPVQAMIEVHGRTIGFPLYDNGIGQFSFHDLCETALGPADYLAIAKRLHTVIISDIPILGPEKRNEAKRFVTFIDALYEQKRLLIATAQAMPEALYTEGHGAFEFQRTVSRLIEMQSENYIANAGIADKQ